MPLGLGSPHVFTAGYVTHLACRQVLPPADRDTADRAVSLRMCRFSLAQAPANRANYRDTQRASALAGLLARVVAVFVLFVFASQVGQLALAGLQIEQQVFNVNRPALRPVFRPARGRAGSQ